MIKNWKKFNESLDDNVWTVVAFDGYDNRRAMHIIENEKGDRKRVDLMDVSDDHLAEIQPQLSDDEDGWDSAWDEYEDYQQNYLIGKRIKEVNFDFYLV